MTTQRFVALGLRLFALWLAWGAFEAVGVGLATNRMATGPFVSTPVIAGIGIAFLAVALILWIFAKKLSQVLLPGTPESELLHLPASEFLVAGCILMGLWFLKTSIIPLFGIWLKGMAISSTLGPSAFETLRVQDRINMGMLGLQVVFALLLIFRPRPIVRILMRGERIPNSTQEISAE